jgi:hypothetical protein
MRRRIVRRWMAGSLLLAAAMMAPMTALAQGGQDGEGGVSFAGGQMVRGTVTAVAADRLTVKTEAGELYQVAVSANTRLTKGRQPVKVAEIKVGDGVGAMGVMDAGSRTVHAVFVGVVSAEQIRKAREGMGKVYITGKVTAIDRDALKLTVMRSDGVSQVIGVDEGTSFKRGGREMTAVTSFEAGEIGDGGGPGRTADGGESITLMDVKVGDSIAGRGALKRGFFVPTELGVMDAPAAGQRRRREGSTSASPGGVPQ